MRKMAPQTASNYYLTKINIISLLTLFTLARTSLAIQDRPVSEEAKGGEPKSFGNSLYLATLSPVSQASDLLLETPETSLEASRTQHLFFGAGLIHPQTLTLKKGIDTLCINCSPGARPFLEAGLSHRLTELLPRSYLFFTGVIGYTSLDSLVTQINLSPLPSRMQSFQASFRLSLFFPPLLSNRWIPFSEMGGLWSLQSRWGSSDASSFSSLIFNPVLSVGVQFRINPSASLSVYQTGEFFSIPWIIYLKWSQIIAFKTQPRWFDRSISIGGGIDL
jgi:hypothetical protein